MNDNRQYCVIAHACRLCGGRLLRGEKGETVRYRCANCGIHKDVEGDKARSSHRLLCFCGARPPGGVRVALRCIANPQPCLEAPDQIIATAIGLADPLVPDA